MTYQPSVVLTELGHGGPPGSVHTRTLTRLMGERAWYPQISATRPSGPTASAERAPSGIGSPHWARNGAPFPLLLQPPFDTARRVGRWGPTLFLYETGSTRRTTAIAVGSRDCPKSTPTK